MGTIFSCSLINICLLKFQCLRVLEKVCFKMFVMQHL